MRYEASLAIIQAIEDQSIKPLMARGIATLIHNGHGDSLCFVRRYSLRLKTSLDFVVIEAEIKFGYDKRRDIGWIRMEQHCADYLAKAYKDSGQSDPLTAIIQRRGWPVRMKEAPNVVPLVRYGERTKGMEAHE